MSFSNAGNSTSLKSETAAPSLNFPKPAEFKLDYGDIKIVQELGKGTFGKVSKAVWSGLQVAVKEMQEQKSSEEFEKEMKTLLQFHFPRIVTLIGYTLQPNCLVMKYMARGTLKSVIDKKTKSNMPWSRKLSMALNLSEGLIYLHKNKFVHGDIKTSNLLVNQHWEISVGDFGSAVSLENTRSIQALGGTILYLAPELYDDKISFKSDIYAAAIVLWELFTHNTKPFVSDPTSGITEKSGLAAVMNKVCNQNVRPRWPPSFKNANENSKEVKLVKLVESAWKHDHTIRPDAIKLSEALQSLK